MIKEKYGKGYHLTIMGKDIKTFKYSDIEYYKSIFDKNLRSSEL